jgi:hypothetical protein
LTVGNHSTHSLSWPKAAAVVAGVGIAAGLALAAPVRAASPSTAASRIVAAQLHKKPPGGTHQKHHTARHRTAHHAR